MDWTEKIEQMDRKRLEIFAIHTLGCLLATSNFLDKTPEQVFDFIWNIGVSQYDGNDFTDD